MAYYHIENRLAVVPFDQSRLITLNHIATLIFQFIDAQGSASGLLDYVLSSFECPSTLSTSKDINEAISTMIKFGIIVEQEP